MKRIRKYFILLLIFSIVNLVCPQTQTLIHGKGLELNGNKDKAFIIKLDGNNYYNYIAIKFVNKGSQNPYVYVVKDDNCYNGKRLFVSVQLVDPIYAFFNILIF